MDKETMSLLNWSHQIDWDIAQPQNRTVEFLGARLEEQMYIHRRLRELGYYIGSTVRLH